MNGHQSVRPDSGPRRIGEIAERVVVDVGFRAIAFNLEAGRLDDADGIRRQMGLSWAQVVGAEGRAA
jgi:hypothetical protein